jgi:hypothetical protein
VVCRDLITMPDDYLSLGWLTDDVQEPLHRFNDAHVHRSCSRRWPELSLAHAFAANQLASGTWKGKAIELLVNSLKSEQEREL